MTSFLKSGDSRIRKLLFEPYAAEGELRGWNYVHKGADAMDAAVIGTALLAMVTESSVRILSLGTACDKTITPNYDSLLKGMVRKKSRVRLSKLLLLSAEDNVLKALVQFLCHSNLEEIVVEYRYLSKSYQPVFSRLLYLAIHQNVFLQSFTLKEKRYSSEPALVPEWLNMNKMDAYCQRNMLVPMLLTQRDPDKTSKMDHCLVPTLFWAMRLTCRVAGHTIFRGLLEALGGVV
jgi:hypothetical protein